MNFDDSQSILLANQDNKLTSSNDDNLEFIFENYVKKLENIKLKKNILKKINKKNINENKEKYNNLILFSNEIYDFILEVNDFPETNNDSLLKKINSINRNANLFLFKVLKSINKLKWVEKWNPLTNNNIIELNNINKYYSSSNLNTRVLTDISIEVKKGDFVVILGPSGSGKTTLMNLLSGMDYPSYGKINIANYNTANLSNSQLTKFRKKEIGYVFQRYGLLPNLSVYENVCMGLYLGKKETNKVNTALITKEDRNKILDILKMVDMVGHINSYPYELSGGQKQRVSIARVIAKSPNIIFGDEPTASVDVELSKSIIELFKKINDLYKTTIIIITHDESISKYANRVIYIKDGKIENIILKK